MKIRFLESFISETGKTEFPALSVQQPYAQMLVSGYKNKEFRNCRLPEKHIGEWILIHSSTTKHGDLFGDPVKFEEFFLDYDLKNLPEHAIIGAVKFSHPEDTDFFKYRFAFPVTDCVQFTTDIKNIQGRLGIWKYKINI